MLNINNLFEKYADEDNLMSQENFIKAIDELNSSNNITVSAPTNLGKSVAAYLQEHNINDVILIDSLPSGLNPKLDSKLMDIEPLCKPIPIKPITRQERRKLKKPKS